MKFWIFVLCLFLTLQVQASDQALGLKLPERYRNDFPDLSDGRLVSVQEDWPKQTVVWNMNNSMDAMVIHCVQHMRKNGWRHVKDRTEGSVRQYTYDKQGFVVEIVFVPHTEGVMVEFIYHVE